MKILYKYVLKEFIRPVIFCIGMFLILFILSETFRILNIENKLPNSFYYGVLYMIYEIPYWISQILPIAMLLGFLFFFTGLSVSNEVVAIKAGGININKVFMPIILLSIFFSFAILVANETFLTNLTRKGKEFLYYDIKGRERERKALYKDINYIGQAGLKYIAKAYDPIRKTLYGINIDKFTNDLELVEQIYAKKAVFVKDGKWRFYDGVFREFDGFGDVLIEKDFKKREFVINEEPDTFKIEDIKIEQITMKDLKKHIAKLKKNSIPINEELTELYNKVAFPFVNFIVILIGISFASSNMKNNRVISFGIGLFMTFLYWGTMSIFMTFGGSGFLHPIIAAWSTNILYFILSLIFIFKLKR